MIIREMNEQDIEAVSAICMASFSSSVAGDLPGEGVSTFAKIVSRDALRDRMTRDTVILVAEYNERIEGVVELKEGRHISMLFVEPEFQRKGIGRKLLSSALNYARADIVTVRASLSSVPAYEKYGFESRGDISESSGLVYQPMEIELNRARPDRAANKDINRRYGDI